MRDIYARCFIMKMLLASNNVLALQPVAARLVANGIPIALEKPSQFSSHMEIWIQRDGDYSLASRLLPAGIFRPMVAPPPRNPSYGATAHRSAANERAATASTAEAATRPRWLRRLQQTWRRRDG